MESLAAVLAPAIFEGAPDGILVTNQKGEVVLANRRAEVLFGHSREALQGQAVEALLPDRMRLSHQALRDAYARQPRTRSMGDGAAVMLGRRKDGTEFPVEISLSPVTFHGESWVVAIVRDVTARTEIEARLRYLGTRDGLTGLYNRVIFEEELGRLQQGGRHRAGVVVVDVDGLKDANDNEGHAAGDELLKRTAQVLKACFRTEDIVARLGGDEFGIIMDAQDAKAPELAVQRLVTCLAEHNASQEGPPLSFSVGAVLTESGESPSNVMRRADACMYQDKRSRRAGRGSTPPKA